MNHARLAAVGTAAALGIAALYGGTSYASTPHFRLPAAGSHAYGYLAYQYQPAGAADTMHDRSRVWDVATHKVTATWKFRVDSAHFTPDGVVVDAGDGTYRVVRLDGSTVRTPPSAGVGEAAVSPLGTLTMQAVSAPSGGTTVQVRRTTAGAALVSRTPSPTAGADCTPTHGFGPNSFVMECDQIGSTDYLGSFRTYEVNYTSGKATPLSPAKAGIADTWSVGSMHVGQRSSVRCGGELRKVTANSSTALTLPGSNGVAPYVVGTNGSQLFYLQADKCHLTDNEVGAATLRSWDPRTGAVTTIAGSTQLGHGSVDSAVLVSPSQ